MCFAFVLTSLVGTAENIAIAKSLILEKAASGNVLSFLTSLVECDCYRFFFCPFSLDICDLKAPRSLFAFFLLIDCARILFFFSFPFLLFYRFVVLEYTLTLYSVKDNLVIITIKEESKKR